MTESSHTLAEQDLASLRRATAEAVMDLSNAKGELVSVMEAVRSLSPALKTGICSALENAVDRVSAAEARLSDVAADHAKSSEGSQRAAAPSADSVGEPGSATESAPAVSTTAAAAPVSTKTTPAVPTPSGKDNAGLWMFGALLAGATAMHLLIPT